MFFTADAGTHCQGYCRQQTSGGLTFDMSGRLTSKSMALAGTGTSLWNISSCSRSSWIVARVGAACRAHTAS